MSDALDRLTRLQAYWAQDPDNVALVCDLLDSQFSLGQHAEAEAFIVGLSPVTQSAPGVRFRRARVALVQGRYADAIDLLQGLIAEGHDSVALWHDLAFAQLCLRNTDDAATTLSEAQTRFGADAELSVVAARVAMMVGDFERAQVCIAQALSLAPEHATAWGLQSLALLDAGQPEAALPVADACLAKHPDQHEALLVAGTVALWRQDISRADAAFARALSRHPNSGRALSGYGQLNMLRNDLPGGRDVFLRAVVAMPDHIGTWHALAWSQLLLGDIDAAESSYQRAYDLDRNFADSHGGLALIHALKGRTDEADQAIKRALRLNAQCATALYAKSLLLLDAGRDDEAERALVSALGTMGLPPGIGLRDFARQLRSRIATPIY